MNKTTIEILPTAALEIFMLGATAADVLDEFASKPAFELEAKAKPSPAAPRKANFTPRHIRLAIAKAEDVHAGISDETAGTL